jgi:hypothetical protein
MAKKKAKKKATKSSARKSLKLRKKPLRDLPARKKSTKVKGGADVSLSPSQQAALTSQTKPTSRCNRACRIPARPSPAPDHRA